MQPAILEEAETSEETNGHEQSTAQSQFVNDKLESVTQELLGLRVEHESTVQDYEHLALKYEEALRTLAELQDAVDEARHSGQVLSPASTRPTSFLDETRMSDIREGPDSSRSLSSELSLAGELASSSTEATEIYETDAHTPRGDEAQRREAVLLAEIEALKKLHADKEEHITVLTDQCNKMQEQQQDSEDLVEELKAEVQKAQLASMANNAATERNVIRRKSSQNSMVLDRAHRSFAGLKNIASDHLESNPDAFSAFEVNLNAAMQELHLRSERIQELENQIDNVKKEMETKVQIISGLSRERGSIRQASPVDISVVSSMRDQILDNEKQLTDLRTQLTAREEELSSEIASLKGSLEAQVAVSASATQALEEQHAEQLAMREQTITQLNQNVSELEEKHHAAVNAMHGAQNQLDDLANELDVLRSQQSAGSREFAALSDEHQAQQSHIQSLENEHQAQQTHIQSLQDEIAQHQQTIAVHLAQIQTLGDNHNSSKAELERHLAATSDEHSSVISSLSKEIDDHKSALHASRDRIAELQAAHAENMDELHQTLTADAAEQAKKHDTAMADIQQLLFDSHASLKDHQDRLAMIEASAQESVAVIDKLHTEKQLLSDQALKSQDLVNEVQRELAFATEESQKHLGTINELKKLHEESLEELGKLAERDVKNTRLIEELENELSQTFDQQQSTSNRLSSLQTERNRALEEAQANIETLRDEVAALQTKLGQAPESPQRANAPGRTSSMTSNLRKSASTASLPSPPPAIPLPPLPNGMPQHPAVASVAAQNGQPPTPTMSRRPSKDLATSQLAEDQEARIRTIEKHLFAEKQLTHTLEEALTDLERQGKKTETELGEWKKKFARLEEENERLKQQSQASRYSLQTVEEERIARKEAETARQHLEERMNQINKKKGRTLMCF